MKNEEYDVDSCVRIADIRGVRNTEKINGHWMHSTETLHFIFDEGGITIKCGNNVSRIACKGSPHHKAKCAYATELDGGVLDGFLTAFAYTYNLKSIVDEKQISMHYLRFFYSKERGECGFRHVLLPN